MSQATIADYPTGGTTNADERDHSSHQAPLSPATAAGGTIDLPDSVGAYERVRTPHAGELAAWSDGSDRVAVVRIIGSDTDYEVTGADMSRPNPGRIISTAPDRGGAVQRAREYMGGDVDGLPTDQTL